MNRLQVQAQIVTCTVCELSERCTAPVPFDGPSPALLCVVGEAPGKQEDEAGRPFVGLAGQLLRELLVEAGFDLDEIFWCNAASCFPVDFAGKGRAPNDLELRACHDNLVAQMELSESRYFLLTGGVPLKAVRPGLKISQARGVPFLLDPEMGGKRFLPVDRLALPTFHPSYVLRKGGKDTEVGSHVREDLAYLSRLMAAGPEKWASLFPDTCLLCDGWAERYADDGIGYCEGHWSGRS